MSKKKSFYLNMSNIREDIKDICEQIWENVEVGYLENLSGQDRCRINIDGKEAILDFYHKKDGSTSIVSTGKNKDISNVIKSKIESNCEYSSDLKNSIHSFKNIKKEWSTKFIDYLYELSKNKVEKKRCDFPPYNYYKFTGESGDSLVVNIYDNGTITLQGKPAFLYGEAISFLSYCRDISMDDIVDSVNNVYSIDVKTNDVRNELKYLLPNSYINLDDTILKILSPSISLRKTEIPLEDYSCYAFPALRALEAYMKFLLLKKNIRVNNTFFGVFRNGKLLNYNDDIVFKDELENLYSYLKNNRHVIFHANQMLFSTRVIENKSEADQIVNDVLDNIETSYKKINRIVL